MVYKLNCILHIAVYFSEAKEIQDKFDQISIPNESEASSYYFIREQLENLSKQFQSFLTLPQYLMPFLQPGRMVKVRNIVQCLVQIII